MKTINIKNFVGKYIVTEVAGSHSSKLSISFIMKTNIIRGCSFYVVKKKAVVVNGTTISPKFNKQFNTFDEALIIYQNLL